MHDQTDTSDLLPQAQHQLNIFKRQYFQLQTNIRFPDSEWLRQDYFQRALYSEIFSDDRNVPHPSKRYQLRILKELISRIESSIIDWDEEVRTSLVFCTYFVIAIIPKFASYFFLRISDFNIFDFQGVSDDLMSYLSTLMSTPLVPEVISVRQKEHVTYTLSGLSPSSVSAPTITLLESRNLLAATGTTGFRTWEACLHLGTYLCFPHVLPGLSVTGRNILELGAGTGLLSILCAKHLGAAHVTASDGYQSVITDLSPNFYLNGLQNSPSISIKELIWGHAFLGGEESSFLEGRQPDLVLGADVTYDAKANPALVATFGDLFALFPNVIILIAATIRNRDTWNKFLSMCELNCFMFEVIEFPIQPPEQQEGPFYDGEIPIQICRIEKHRE